MERTPTAEPAADGPCGIGTESAAFAATAPGLAVRSLLWAALLIDFVPILVTTPILISGDPAMFAVIELVNIASGITSMLLGAAAMPSRSLA